MRKLKFKKFMTKVHVGSVLANIICICILDYEYECMLKERGYKYVCDAPISISMLKDIIFIFSPISSTITTSYILLMSKEKEKKILNDIFEKNKESGRIIKIDNLNNNSTINNENKKKLVYKPDNN